jgi:hypothetical protein
MSDNAPSLIYMTQTKYWRCNGHFIDVQTSHFTRQKIEKKIDELSVDGHFSVTF